MGEQKNEVSFCAETRDLVWENATLDVFFVPKQHAIALATRFVQIVHKPSPIWTKSHMGLSGIWHLWERSKYFGAVELQEPTLTVQFW
jgi:hypothetical protein